MAEGSDYVDFAIRNDKSRFKAFDATRGLCIPVVSVLPRSSSWLASRSLPATRRIGCQ
jgi:hypothetical protein